MPAQSLTWGLNGFGSFTDPVRWVPREAPTPNANQTLNIAAGSLQIASQPWGDYDLVLSGQYVGVTFVNQTLDPLSTVRQTAPTADINVDGINGLNSFADFDLGASGAQATTNVYIAPGSVFRNNGTVEVDGKPRATRSSSSPASPSSATPTCCDAGPGAWRHGDGGALA